MTISINPMSRPPSTAPAVLPMPPSTAAMKHLMPGIAPMVGLMRVYFMPHIIAPTPASAEPMKKVMAMVRFRSMPIRLAAS